MMELLCVNDLSVLGTLRIERDWLKDCDAPLLLVDSCVVFELDSNLELNGIDLHLSARILFLMKSGVSSDSRRERM